MRVIGALLAAVALAGAFGGGCGKVKPGVSADGGAGSGAAGQSAAGLTPCLDRPSDLARPPAGSLPCDMLPPTFGK